MATGRRSWRPTWLC